MISEILGTTIASTAFYIVIVSLRDVATFWYKELK